MFYMFHLFFFSRKNITWTLFYYSFFMELWNSPLLLTTHTNNLPFTWLRRKWNLTNQAMFFHCYKFHFQCMRAYWKHEAALYFTIIDIPCILIFLLIWLKLSFVCTNAACLLACTWQENLRSILVLIGLRSLMPCR